MAKLPKRLIKKYGISKKAWQVFRNEKKGRKKASTTPKKRVSRVRLIKSKQTSFRMAKKKHSRKKGMFGALNRPVVSGVTYALVQPFVSQFLGRFNIGVQDEIVQIGAAIVAKNMIRNPIVNNWANAAIIVNTASLTQSFAGKFTSGLIGGTPKQISSTPTVTVVG